MPFTVFGYGSLVHRGTLTGVLSVERATLNGWRRAWRALSRPGHFGACTLSAVPAEDAIEGLFVTFDDDHRERLAEREHNYDAIALGGPDSVIYRVKPEADGWGDASHPIARSYLDTVLAGYFREFGEDGVRRFLATTDGWHAPIREDRETPTYPRVQPLDGSTREAIDRLLAGFDASCAVPQQSADR